MKLLSIQVGTPREITWGGKRVSTGIFKSAVHGPVQVRSMNIDGDRQADLTVHGGRDKAVYAYGADAFPWWREKLGDDTLDAGAFGENLTVSTLDETTFHLGNIYRLGACDLQVTQPRFPCFKLGIKFNDMGILKTFMQSNRPGVYFRVLREGKIEAGNDFVLLTSDPEKVSVTELFNLKGGRYLDTALVARILRVESLNAEWRERLSNI